MKIKNIFICIAVMVLTALATVLVIDKVSDSSSDASAYDAGYFDGWYDALEGKCGTDSMCWDMYHTCEGYGMAKFCE